MFDLELECQVANTKVDARMQSKHADFCTFREIRAAIVTWNAGASTPGSVRNSDFIRDAVHPEDPPEIIVFGFQELVDLENKKITASTFSASLLLLRPLLTLLFREPIARKQEKGARQRGTHESPVPGMDRPSDSVSS